MPDPGLDPPGRVYWMTCSIRFDTLVSVGNLNVMPPILSCFCCSVVSGMT